MEIYDSENYEFWLDHFTRVTFCENTTEHLAKNQGIILALNDMMVNDINVPEHYIYSVQQDDVFIPAIYKESFSFILFTFFYPDDYVEYHEPIHFPRPFSIYDVPNIKDQFPFSWLPTNVVELFSECNISSLVGPHNLTSIVSYHRNIEYPFILTAAHCVKPYESSPNHKHVESVEAFFVLRGSFAVVSHSNGSTVNNMDVQTLYAEENATIIVPTGMWRMFYATSPNSILIPIVSGTFDESSDIVFDETIKEQMHWGWRMVCSALQWFGFIQFE